MGLQSIKVSVVVLSYNSSSTILETLDSIFNQSYKDIELIISDDCSKDNSVELANRWASEHRSRFSNVIVLANKQNLGTCNNINKSIIPATGEWIKSIAADDLLKPEAISSYVEYVLNNPTCEFVLCRIEPFSNSEMDLSYYEKYYDLYFQLGKEPLYAQKQRIIKECIFPGPGYFIKREMLNRIGCFDEDYRLMEEWPFCFKVLMNDIRIWTIDEKLIRYRVSNTSVSHSSKLSPVAVTLFNDYRRFFYKKRLALLIKSGNFKVLFNQMLHIEYRMLKNRFHIE